MSEFDRYKLQPALAKAAECACSYYLTDGFCMPRDRQQCKCWAKAWAVMEATGLSARAVGFIFQHRQRIEETAEAAETKTFNGTPWWSKPERVKAEETTYKQEQEGASEGEGDWRNSIGDDGHQVSPPYRSDFPDDHTDPAYGSWFVPAPEQEGASEALGEPKASEHISPERRRGLEEAARLIEKKHTNNVGMVHPMAASDAAAIRALIPPSSEGGSPR
jgi:hypothetical protein